MIKVAGTIAFLCSSVAKGQWYLVRNEKVMQYEGTTRALIERSGKYYQAVIVTQEAQLRAVELKEFVVVDAVSPQLQDLARSRVR